LVFLFKKLTKGSVLTYSGLKKIGVWLYPLRQMIFKLVILPAYGQYLWIKVKANRIAPKKKDRFVLIFTNRYLIHILIVVLSFGVMISNTLAFESKDDYGQNALMYRLAGIGSIEIIEDNASVDEANTIYNYQEQGTFIEGNSFASDLGTDSDNIFTDQANVMGDLALIKPDIVSTDDAKRQVGIISEYIVNEGDTISNIGRRFGVSVNTILWANNLSFSSYVKPGQKLLIPSVSGVIHKVVKGDILSKIAIRYGVDSVKIREANGIIDDNLTVGVSLIIPGGTIIETAKPKTVVTAPTAKTPNKSDYQNDQPIASTGVMAWPSACRRISQYYKGWLHTGLDIACPWGTALRAADGGRVTRVQYGKTGYGYNVMIDHGGGIVTLYGHMSAIDVKVGEYVERGQVIGAEGSTGRSTGPHVHFEVRVNGTMVNPLNYIR
jgi:murein DD-endopeptidase MepM/ murein hydrolase activator NlpD